MCVCTYIIIYKKKKIKFGEIVKWNGIKMDNYRHLKELSREDGKK